MAKDDIDLEFEDDFEDLEDFEDFDFDDLESNPVESIPTIDPKTGKKRSPVEMAVLKTYTAAKEEMKSKTFRDYAKATISKSLSSEGNSNIEDIRNTLTDIIDTTKEQLKPLGESLHKLTKYGANKLPTGSYIQNILNKVSEKLSQDSLENTASIKETLYNFSSDIENSFKSIEDNLNNSNTVIETNLQNLTLNSDILKILSTSTNINNIIKEQNKIYYHKSLQLQWRMVHGIEEALDTSRKHFEVQSKQLEAIVKNTALPEAVKIENSELLTQTMKTRTMSKITDQLYGEGSFLDRLKNKIVFNIKDKIATANDVSTAIGELTEQSEMMKEMGISKEQMFGSTIANTLTGIIGKQASKLIPRRLRDNFEYDLASIANNPLEYLKNKRIENPEGLLGKLSNKLIDYTTSSDLMQNKNKIELRRTGLESQAIFDGRTHSTINIVIPKLLSKIQNELYGIRTSSNITEDNELRYDHSSGKFLTTSETRSNLRKDINKIAKEATRRNVRYLKSHIEDVLTDVNTPNKDKILKHLEDALLGYIVNHGSILPESLLSQEFLSYIPGELQLEAADIFNEFIKMLKSGKNPNTTSFYFKYASNAPKVPTALLQGNLGSNIDLLQDMNLVNVNRYDNTVTTNTKELQSVMTGNLNRYRVKDELIKNVYDDPISFRDDLKHDFNRARELATNYINRVPTENEETIIDGVRHYEGRYGTNIENSYIRLSEAEERKRDNELRMKYEIDLLEEDEQLNKLKKENYPKYEYEYNKRVNAIKSKYSATLGSKVTNVVNNILKFKGREKSSDRSARIKTDSNRRNFIPSYELNQVHPRVNIDTPNIDLEPLITPITDRPVNTVNDTKDIISNNIKKVEEISTPVQEKIEATTERIATSVYDKILDVHRETVRAGILQENDIALESLEERKVREEKEKTTVESIKKTVEEVKDIKEEVLNNIKEQTKDIKESIQDSSRIQNLKEATKQSVNDAKESFKDKAKEKLDKTTDFIVKNRNAFRDPVSLIKAFGPKVGLAILKSPYKFWNSGFAKKMRAKERAFYGKLLGKMTPNFIKEDYRKTKEDMVSLGTGISNLFSKAKERKNSWENRLAEMDKKRKESSKPTTENKEKKTLWDRIKGLFKPAMLVLPLILKGITSVVSGIKNVGSLLMSGIGLLKPLGGILTSGIQSIITLLGGKKLLGKVGTSIGTKALGTVATATTGIIAKKLAREAGEEVAKKTVTKTAEKVATTTASVAATQTTSKVASKAATKLSEKSIANQIVKILESFKSKALQKLGPKAGQVLASRIGMLIAKRLIPVAGWSLLIWDAGWIIKYMTVNGLDLKSAVSKQVLGFDLFNDDEPALDEDGNPIKPDEQETPKDKEYKKVTEEKPKEDKKEEKEDSGFKWYNPSTWFGNNAKKKEEKVKVENNPVQSSQPLDVKSTMLQMMQSALSSYQPSNKISYIPPDYNQALATKGYQPKPAKIDTEFKKNLLQELNKEMTRLNMSKEEKAAFLATVDVETGSLRTMTENLNYRKERLLQVFPKYFRGMSSEQLDAYANNPVALGNRVYSGRMGNGPSNTGDGFKYRGRGLIQLTGKDNYTRFSKDTGIDVVNNPDLISTDPAVAARTATWYWETRGGLRSAAQRGDTIQVRKLVNGGLNGYDHFRNYYNSYINGKGPLTDGLTNIDTTSSTSNTVSTQDANRQIDPNSTTTENKNIVSNTTDIKPVEQVTNPVQTVTPTVTTPVAPVAPMGSVSVETPKSTTVDKVTSEIDLTPVATAISKSDTTQKQQLTLQEEMVNLLKKINEQLNLSNQPEDDKAATRIQNIKKENQGYQNLSNENLKNESLNTIRPDRNRKDPVFSLEAKVSNGFLTD